MLHYATIAAPLTGVTRGGSQNTIPCGEAQQQSFQTLERVLCSKLVLRLPDVQRPFILRTDASDFGLGGVLYCRNTQMEYCRSHTSAEDCLEPSLNTQLLRENV